MEIYGRVEDLAQTPKCLAQTHTFAPRGSPSPTVYSQSKRSPSRPGDAWRQLPPSIVSDKSILLGACCSQEAHCAGRSEARGQRSNLAETLGTWVR